MGDSAEALEKVRVDRWLWAVRLFKTRGQAAEACRGGKVHANGEKLKPSRFVRVGERLEVSKEGILREVKVVGLLEKRVGAKLVENYMQDLTPPERFELLRMTAAQHVLRRDAGLGRPTKRDRREIEKLFGE
ncbi:S4 domain-containing protein [Pelagicoccus sp. SDUM812003]|uniref:RNA-binding S4 domain-containing protein n=1 Tax=Pelagicoccus sp. SDUM812003 TaxID=3041267 RepID=UPI00280CA6AD|nr:S4 domain-containing protein [Pelagicoccus sp. SDUM812003]MDQ8205547.1 S4 domain-containing protein [Pelagicoccus sp. SDUM812003]